MVPEKKEKTTEGKPKINHGDKIIIINSKWEIIIDREEAVNYHNPVSVPSPPPIE